jgi:hypothetical protein
MDSSTQPPSTIGTDEAVSVQSFNGLASDLTISPEGKISLAAFDKPNLSLPLAVLTANLSLWLLIRSLQPEHAFLWLHLVSTLLLWPIASRFYKIDQNQISFLDGVNLLAGFGGYVLMLSGITQLLLQWMVH